LERIERPLPFLAAKQRFAVKLTFDLKCHTEMLPKFSVNLLNIAHFFIVKDLVKTSGVFSVNDIKAIFYDLSTIKALKLMRNP